MKNKMKTTEMEDFEILYKNIGNEVIKERIRSSGQWYIERAIRYKRYFYSLSIISIILPLIISSVNILGASWENEVRIVTTIASAIVSMVTGLLTFTKCGEKWTLYRSTIEMIKSELTLFWTKTPVPDEKDLANLTYRLEEIMNKEHSRWKKMQQEDDKITLKSNEKNEETGELEEVQSIDSKQYINEKDVINRQNFVLGTDNFGRDVLTELISATGSSLKIGLVAGIIATVIGLFLGLLAGYLGGFVDNLILFFTNLFTVIPSFVLLILISYSVGESQRGIMMVALLIGITAWPWTTRSVRSQVISLRNRDHVNLSKLSGHSMLRIVLTDILPYVASYVVMAFILQISSGILAEAQLSMIGLGPATTKTATLGLMMQWATQYNAHLNGAWWAYFPVILVIALISFSLNLMNTGLDQVFNPQLRD